MIGSRCLAIITALFLLSGLTGCLFPTQEKPEVITPCRYTSLLGDEFTFMALPAAQQAQGYTLIHTNNSRSSATLPYAPYHGMRGKLTDEISVRNYPKPSTFTFNARRCSVFNECDNPQDNAELYLTPRQREVQERDAIFAVRKAILSNCEVVYIRLDSLRQDRLSPALILPAGLEVSRFSEHL